MGCPRWDKLRTLAEYLRCEDVEIGGLVDSLNRIAAERFFPNEDPIGKRVWFGGGSNFDRPDSAAEIVGIVGDVAYQSLDERPMQPDFYTPYPQFTYASRAVLVRALGDPASLVPAIRRAVRRADPSLALYEVRTMEERLGDASAGRRFDTLLLSGFAVVATVEFLNLIVTR